MLLLYGNSAELLNAVTILSVSPGAYIYTECNTKYIHGT